MAELATSAEDAAAAPRPASPWPRRLAILAIFAVLAAVPPVAAWLAQPFYVRLAMQIMIFGMAAISLDLILGYGGLVSLGHASYLGVAAYVVGILAYHVDNGGLLFGVIPGTDNAFIAWPTALLVCAAAALFIGAVSLRTSGAYFIMITLAFAQMIFFFFDSLPTYGGEYGLQISDLSWPMNAIGATGFYYFVLASLIVVAFLVQRIVGSRFGMVIRGARQNNQRLQAMGFPTFRYRLAAFVIAGVIAGYAGILLAEYQLFIDPTAMAWVRSAELIVMVAVGGAGTIYGSIVGAAIFVLLKLVVGSYTVHWELIFGPFFIAVVLGLRRGFFSLAFGSDRDG
ncbi:MAG TPA: branched-chain amino acid ABC transporter permease [Hyphomicrobiales bacterium]|nr:branched-chain amino acid ABC transporter permease [Hyphomicrobiales bacterium]